MDEYTIRQAIDLIKARRPLDARKLLRPVLEVNPENEAAWVWFTSTFISPADKLQVMRQAALYIPNSQPIARGIEKLVEEIDNANASGENLEESDISAYMPHFAQADRDDGLANFKPGDLPSSWNNSTASTPAVKEPSRPIKKAEDDPADWINQLRITSSNEVVEEKPARAPFSWEEPDLPIYEPEPAAPEPAPVFHAPPQNPWDQGQDFRVSPPPKQEQPQRDIPPWEMPMQSTALQQPFVENRRATAAPRPQRIKVKDPYQGPFVTAAIIGGVLLLILLVMMYVIVLQTT